MPTFRAAYIAPDFGSNGVGILLTSEDQANLSDADLLAVAEEVLSSIGVDGEIEIGEWTE